MDEATITTIQEKLAKDLYELSTSHREEIAKLMEDYDNHHMATIMQIDAYERECRQRIGELGATRDKDPYPNELGHTVLVNDIAVDTEPEEAKSKLTKRSPIHLMPKLKPNLFDILDEDVSGSDDGDPIDDAQEDDQG